MEINKMNTIFQFKHRPKYKPSSINYQKAYVHNTIRSFYLNKVRFFKKWVSYKKFENSIKNLTLEHLAKITQLNRPGLLQK